MFARLSAFRPAEHAAPEVDKLARHAHGRIVEAVLAGDRNLARLWTARYLQELAAARPEAGARPVTDLQS